MTEHRSCFRRFNFVLLVCVFILMLPYYYYLFGNYYGADTDEAFQLQAAVRMANGKGYTSTHLSSYLFKGGQTDLKYRRMISWPIGYSFVISRLMIIGLDLDLAAKLFKMLVIISGIFLWIKLASRFMESRLPLAMFAFLLCLTVMYFSRATTELILWALFPLLSMLMFDLYFLRRKENHRSCEFKILWRVLVSGIIASLMILTKYSGIPGLMIGIAWIIALNTKKYRDAVIQSMLFAIIPVITMVLIFYSNRIYTGRLAMLSLKNIPTWQMDILDVPAMLFFTLFPQRLLNYVVDGLALNVYTSSAILKILGWSFVGWLFYIYRKNRHLEDNYFIKWTILSFVCICVFLITFMVVFANGSIPQARLFLIITPFILMIIIQQGHIFLKRHMLSKNTVNYILAVVFLICLSVNYSFAKYLDVSVGSHIAEKHDVVNMAKSIMENHSNSSVIAFATNYAYYYLFENLSVPTYQRNINQRNTKNILDPTPIISDPELVFVISDLRLDGADKEAEILTGHRFHSIKIGLTSLYWKQFGPNTK